MGYVDDNLLPSEIIIHRARLHRIVFARAFVLAIIGAAIIFLGLSVPDEVSGGAMIFGGIFVLLVAALTALSRCIVSWTSEFAVTNKRVLIKVGLIRRKTLEVLLAKIETIGVEQGIMGRLLGYGTIEIIGTGGTRESFRDIASPLEFRRQVQSQIAA